MTSPLPTLAALARRGAATSLLVLAGPAAAQAPAWQWAIQTTNPTLNDNSQAAGRYLATDATAHVYVGGSLGFNYSPLSGVTTTRTFGSVGPLGGNLDSFVARVSSAGQWEWATHFWGMHARDSGRAIITGMTASPAGDVYVTGEVLGELYVNGTDWGIGPGSLSLSHLTFVARLNAQGVCQWVRYQDYFNSPKLAFDPSTGGVVMASQYYSSTTAINSTPLPAPGPNPDVYVVRLSPAGQVLAVATAAGTDGAVEVSGVDVSSTGQVLVCGAKVTGSFSFGSHQLAGSNTAFVVAQLSRTNQWDWALTSPSNAGTSGATSARYGPTGIWVSGFGYNGAVVGAAVLTTVYSNTSFSQEAFLGQLSATGQWGAVQPVAPSTGGAVSLALVGIDSRGNAVAQGVVKGSTTLGAQALTALNFTARLSSTRQWSNIIELPVARSGEWLVNAGTLDVTDHLYFTGSLEGSLTLGATQLLGSGLYPGPLGPIRWHCGDVVLARLDDSAPLASHPAADPLTLTCFPNPAHGRATVRLSAPAATARPLLVLDALGRPVRRALVPARSTELALDLAGLPPGFYALQLAGEGRTTVQRLVVE